jgi:hypothetical protein
MRFASGDTGPIFIKKIIIHAGIIAELELSLFSSNKIPSFADASTAVVLIEICTCQARIIAIKEFVLF